MSLVVPGGRFILIYFFKKLDKWSPGSYYEVGNHERHERGERNMTKQEWKRHWAEVKLEPGHDFKVCRECQSRLKTKRANDRAKAIRHAYSDLGMVRVKGNLGGIYYE
jgi:hypothetical protein